MRKYALLLLLVALSLGGLAVSCTDDYRNELSVRTADPTTTELPDLRANDLRQPADLTPAPDGAGPTDGAPADGGG